MHQLLDQLIVEHIVTNRDEQRATQGLHEGDHRCADRDVLDIQDSLHGNKRLLQSKTDASTEENLVPNPDAGRGVGFPRRQQAAANSREDSPDDHEGSIVSESRDQTTRDQRSHHDAQKHRQVPNTGVHGGDALHRLEPNGDVVDEQEEGGADGEGEEAAGHDGAVAEDARRHGGVLLLPDLDAEKDDDQHAEDDEQADDARVAPGVGGAAPLEGEEERDDGGDEDQRAQGVEASDALGPGFLRRLLLDGVWEKERDDEDCDRADGEVDVETPSP